MKIYKAYVCLWHDAAENWYGCLLNPFFFMPLELTYFCSNSKGKLLNDIKKTMKTFLDRIQNDHGSLPPVPEKEFGVDRLSFHFRSIRSFQRGRFPDPFETEQTSLIVWEKNEEDIINVILPLENIRFSVLKGESIREAAREILQLYCKTNSSIGAVFFDPYVETMIVSLTQPKLGRSEQEQAGSTLSRLATPITQAFRRRLFLQPYCREDQLDRVKLLLQLKHNQNIMLRGITGCGKSTLLVNAVLFYEQTRKKALNQKLHAPMFWWINARQLTVGTQWLGEWQQQVTAVLNELSEINAVLCIENMADLLNTNEDDNSLAAFLIPYLEEHRISIIGEITPQSFQVLSRRLPAFTEQFELVDIPPMTPELAVNAMMEYGQAYESGRQKFHINKNVPATVAGLFRRFFTTHAFPGKAMTFLKKSVQKSFRKKQSLYTQEHVYQDFVATTGLPEWLFRDELTISRQEIEETLTRGVVGQSQAVHAISNAILRLKAGLNRPDKPIGSFLFCGPTGVGKTQLAKTVAEYIFGGQKTEERHRTSEAAAKRLLRIDMSEYQFEGCARRLIEGRNGQSGPLVTHIQREPFSIILLDEIEKASFDTFDLILNLLDEGHLTDLMGRVCHFENTIIIMTSNLGIATQSIAGFSADQSQDQTTANCMKAVMEKFRPEFINRIDEIVTFHHLDHEQCKTIVKMEIAALEHREGLAEKKLKIRATDLLVDKLTQKGFNAQFGARPLRRHIERVVVPVLTGILQLHRPSNRTIVLDWNNKDSDIVWHLE